MNLICHECERSIPADRATSDPAGRWIGFCSMCGAVSIDYGGKIAAQAARIARHALIEVAMCHSAPEYLPLLFRMPGVELPIVPRVALPRIEGAARRQARR